MLGLLFGGSPRLRRLQWRAVCLNSAFPNACSLRLLAAVLKGFQPQHFTVLVTLVQRFKLINEGHGAVALKSFVPVNGCEKKPFFFF